MILSADLSTANVATKNKQVSRLVSAGSMPSTDNIYPKLKLSLAIDSIQMELFTGNRDKVYVLIVILNISAEMYSELLQCDK